MTIAYVLHHSLYLNITNRCPCSCTFCLRQNGDSVGGCDSLWLEREPSFEEIVEALGSHKLDSYREIVFCGYGEPTERLDVLLKVAAYCKSQGNTPVRINTNGLSDLIWQRETAPLLAGLVDTVSISLNASTKERYLELTRSKFGLPSYDAMLHFAAECKRYVHSVVFTIVDVVTSSQEQEACRRVCEGIGVPLRIRPYES